MPTDDYVEDPQKPTRKTNTASRHPASVNEPRQAPQTGDDGIGSGHVDTQRKKIWDERDNPERDQS
jgi:hypothetical protein